MLINARPAGAKTGPKQPGWEVIRQVSSPFQGTEWEDAKSYGYWFNYFWEEAREAFDLSKTDETDLTRAFYEVLKPATGGDGPRFVPVDTLANKSVFTKREVLGTLLRIGFKRVALAPPVGKPTSAAHATDARGIFLEHLEGVKKNRKTTGVPTARQIHLGFRADGRDYDTLVSQGGFLARARSEGQKVHADYALDQPWHPLSLKENAQALFLRKGKSKDNCLHTVISVAHQFGAILPYPLLKDPTLFRLGTKDLAKWDSADVSYAANHRYKVRVVYDPPASKTIDHTESDLRIYVVAVNKSTGFSTFAWQQNLGVTNPFPEAAVDQVAVKHIVAEIVVTRKHFFEGELTFYDFDLKEVVLRPSETALAARFGADFPLRLKDLITGLVGQGKKEHHLALAAYNKKKQAGKQVVNKVDMNKKVTCPVCDGEFSPMTLKRHGCDIP